MSRLASLTHRFSEVVSIRRNTRSSHQSCSVKTDVLKKFARKQLCQSLFFNNSQLFPCFYRTHFSRNSSGRLLLSFREICRSATEKIIFLRVSKNNITAIFIKASFRECKILHVTSFFVSMKKALFLLKNRRAIRSSRSDILQNKYS